MSLIELLVVFFFAGLLMLLGRFLFGHNGWLLGGVPLGAILLLLIVAPYFVFFRSMLRKLKKHEKT